MDDKELELGVQPLDKIMEDRGMKNHDLVAASKDGLTHKQVQKGRKGRRLTRNVQDKIVAAISSFTKETYKLDQLFNYR
jgi:pyrroloquinoline quinone (PQQ) biosynthesis protein C